MADHDLKREESAVDRRVERGGHGRGNTAAEQRQRRASAAQLQALTKPGREAGADMDRRTFAPDRSAGNDRAERGHGAFL